MEAMTATATATRVVFTLRDRCEARACHAQAFCGWTKTGVTDDPLKFCAHHNRDHELVLVASGWELTVDQRAELAKPAWVEPGD